MDLIGMMMIVVLVAMIPFALFLGLIALALVIWSWGRIGRYFINLARWVGDWRNFIPMTLLGTAFFVVVLVLWLYLMPQLRMVWLVILVLQLVITIVCLFFAGIAWIVWFHQWFWPRYRRWLWSVIFRLFMQRPAGQRRRPVASGGRPKPVAGGTPGTASSTAQGPRQKKSGPGSFWALILGKPAQPAKSATAGQPRPAGIHPAGERAAAKRSWLSSLWDLILGKPQPKKREARPSSVQTTERMASPSGDMASAAAVETGVPESAPAKPPAVKREKRMKRSWLGSFWALMLGKPSKPPPRGVQPEEAKARGRADRKARTAAAEAKTRTAARAARPKTGEKSAKRGFFGGTMDRIREGIEWIRVRLNLD